jgi:hypothetical protein
VEVVRLLTGLLALVVRAVVERGVLPLLELRVLLILEVVEVEALVLVQTMLAAQAVQA